MASLQFPQHGDSVLLYGWFRNWNTQTMITERGLFAVGVLLALAATGCSKKLIFVTHTSLGLDISGNAQLPDRVSLTYNRQEFAHVPAKTDGQSHSVFGGLDADIGFRGGSVIEQTFATGDAATAAASAPSGPEATSHKGPTPEGVQKVEDTCCSDPPRKEGGPRQVQSEPLLFTTAATYGLHLSFGDGQVKPTALMGFRRIEAAYVPISDASQEVRPLYADILINSKAEATISSAPARDITDRFPTGEGVRIKQSFGTGRVAVILAKQEQVRAKLQKAAGISPKNLGNNARLEGQIEKRLKSLSQDKASELFEWAGNHFGDKFKAIGGQMSRPSFVNRFLPALSEEELKLVIGKLDALED